MRKIQTILRDTLTLSILVAFFLAPWGQHLDWFPDGPFYFGYYVTGPAILAVGCWLLLGLPGLRSVLGSTRFWWILPLAALAAWALLSPGWATYADIAQDDGQQLALIVLFALGCLCAGPSPRAAIATLAAGAIFQGVIVIVQIGLQRPVGLHLFGEFEILPFNAGLSIVAAGRDHLMRPYGLTLHPNIIGGYFMAALVAMAGWFFVDRGLARWRFAVRIGVVALSLWCLYVTFSRSAWGGLIVGLAALGIASLRRGAVRLPRRTVVLAAAGGLALGGLFVASYTPYILARATVGGNVTELRSISDRRLFIDIALQIIGAHPLKGIGIGNVMYVTDDLIQAGPYRGWLRGDNVHDVPLLIWGELGIVGLGLWLVTLLVGFILIWRQVYDPLSLALAAMLLALVAVGILDHYPWSNYQFSLLFWSSMGISLQQVCNKPVNSRKSL